MLLLTALIWGSSFVAQRAGMEYIGPFTFNGIRSLIGGLVLIPVIFLFSKNKTAQEKKEELTEDEKKAGKKTLLLGGILCGIVLFAASSLQQIGMVYTTAGKAGFITAHCLAVRHTCCRRSVSAVYDGRPFPQPRRSVGAALRLCLFHPHSGD